MPRRIGVDGLMVLPAMVYKSDPRETITHFRAVARATDLPIMVYNNPVSYGVDITPEMFAELADEPTLVAIKESSENVRRITDLMNVVGDRYILFCGVDDLVLESVLLGAQRLGVRAGQRLPRREPRALGPGHRRHAGRRRARSTAGTRRCCTSTPTSSWCSTSSWRWRRRASARRWCGRRGCRWWARSARRSWRIIRQAIATRPALDGESMRRVQRDRFAHRRRADARGRSRAGPTWAAARWPSGWSAFATEHDDVPLGGGQRAARLRRHGRRARCASRSTRRCAAGVIFFNNVGYLGMCGHGTIGVVVTLAHLGRIAPGAHRLETPVGVVDAHAARRSGAVTDRECAQLSHARSRCAVEVPGLGAVRGDVAWGGNWFFLVQQPRPGARARATSSELTDFTWRIRQALAAHGITGDDGGEIDHIELFGPPTRAGRRQQELRALPRQGLRPLALRHRHQRQARLPGRRRQARSRPDLAAGEHRRQRLRRLRAAGRTASVYPAITGSAYVNAEADADPRRARSVLLWDPRSMSDQLRRGHRRAAGIVGAACAAECAADGLCAWWWWNPARSAAARPRPAWATSW